MFSDSLTNSLMSWTRTPCEHVRIASAVQNLRRLIHFSSRWRRGPQGTSCATYYRTHAPVYWNSFTKTQYSDSQREKSKFRARLNVGQRIHKSNKRDIHLVLSFSDIEYQLCPSDISRTMFCSKGICLDSTPRVFTEVAKNSPRAFMMRTMALDHKNNSTQPMCIHRRSALELYARNSLAALLAFFLVRPGSAWSREAGDWSTPGLGSLEDTEAPKFIKSESGVIIQELVGGTGDRMAMPGDSVLVDYVVRRANGYFIYSTVEGVSFQPRDIPTGPVKWVLREDTLLPGLVEGLVGLKRGGRRRILVPPNMGYPTSVNTSVEPKMPTFGTSRQLDNHKNEPLIFEVEVINIQ